MEKIALNLEDDRERALKSGEPSPVELAASRNLIIARLDEIHRRVSEESKRSGQAATGSIVFSK